MSIEDWVSILVVSIGIVIIIIGVLLVPQDKPKILCQAIDVPQDLVMFMGNFENRTQADAWFIDYKQNYTGNVSALELRCTE